jgi:hypothetical protein
MSNVGLHPTRPVTRRRNNEAKNLPVITLPLVIGEGF